MSARLGPFGHMPFTIYWAGGLLSHIGTWLQAVVASVFVYDRTGSALAVGILNFATFVPILLFSVCGGVLSDRVDRRQIAIVTHIASLIVASALAVSTYLGLTSEVHVIVTAFLLQTSWAIAKPSVTSMIPALVPRPMLREAIGLNTLQFMIAQLVGPLLATVLLAASGFTFAFALNAITFLGPVLSMVYLYARGIAGRAPRERGAAVASTSGLVAYMREQPWIAAALVGVVATSAVLEIIRTTAPAIVTTRLGRPSEETGFIFAAASLGMVAGILLAVPLGRRGLARTMAPVGLVFQFAGLLTLGLARDLIVAAPAVALVGCGFSFCFPVLTSALQSEVPDAIRGRLMSIHQMAHLGNRPFAALGAGVITAALGAGAACFAAMLFAPVGLVAVRSAWRALDRRTEVGAVEEGVAG